MFTSSGNCATNLVQVTQGGRRGLRDQSGKGASRSADRGLAGLRGI